MEAVSSSETSVLTRATWHNIPEDGILQRFCRFTSKKVFSEMKFNCSNLKAKCVHLLHISEKIDSICTRLNLQILYSQDNF
jgi:hypothetical protein